MKNGLFLVLCLNLLVCDFILLQAQEISHLTHEELGTIKWYRDYDMALELSKQQKKPIFLLFQEIPGCKTCRDYGVDILSDPFVGEFIEDYFIPLAIFNNKAGKDRAVLKRYQEPSWNNPVIRIIDAKGNDIAKRISGIYTLPLVLGQVIAAMRASFIEVPKYIEDYNQYLQGYQIKEVAYFSMYCFWSGEAAFGLFDGVLSTTPGFANGKEVVRVIYDPNVIKLNKLKSIAKDASAQYERSIDDFKMDKDLQYYLKRSPYRFLPLTPLQRTRINAALISADVDPIEFLSPRQRDLLRKVKNEDQAYPVLYDKAYKLAFGIVSEETTK